MALNRINTRINMKFKILYTFSIVFLLQFCSNQLFAQPSNDECQTAIQITDVTNWCSGFGAFTNVGATDAQPGATPYDPALCFSNLSNDVWFVFTSLATDVNITINGASSNSPGGDLSAPEVALYAGVCGGIISELECTGANASDFAELSQSGLIVGSTYYIRVEGGGLFTGTFELCINNFNPPVDPSSDCMDAAVLCDKSSFTVDRLIGAGNDATELDNATCFNNGLPGIGNEFNSIWFKWTCEQSGTLTFDLIPTRPVADLDFVLFELPGGLNDCANKQVVRCMAAGASEVLYPTPCHGPTGLNLDATDVSENAGCMENQDNYLSALGMVAGQSYALGINNFGPGTEGFTIEFGGTGTFAGPKPSFTFDPPEVMCLDDMMIFDASSIDPDIGNITSYNWNFGVEATPPDANTIGPHTVNYGSVGTKSIVLTVESDQGCIVTEVIEYEVLPCCGDPIPDDLTSDIVNQVDPPCAGFDNGFVTLTGVDGTPFYEYSADGENFQGGQTFSNLTAGDYTFFIRDKLGCEDEIDIIVNEPPPIIVEAGDDITVNLGDDANINAVYSPENATDIISWLPDTLLSCNNCLDPTVLPLGTTTYNITVTNPIGCFDTDSITVFVSENRPIYIPNAFSPNFDGINDQFTIYGNNGADIISTMRIFDRWGNMVFEGLNMMLGDESIGWDGTFRGKRMQPAVFTFYADIRFIDGVSLIYEGDITLVR